MNLQHIDVGAVDAVQAKYRLPGEHVSYFRVLNRILQLAHGDLASDFARSGFGDYSPIRVNNGLTPRARHRSAS